VNAEGLIDTASILGSELIVNGDFATDTNWTKGGGATISGGQANIIGDGSAFGYVEQVGTFVIGKTYKVTLDAIINSGGGLFVKYGLPFAANIGNITTSGSYTFYYTAATSGPIIIGRNTGGVAYNSSVDNVSVKEVITNNVPRLDYSLGGCPKILLEPQRTNLALQSSSFDSASWTKLGATTPIVTANTAISPSGVMDADRLQFANIASSALVYQSLSHTSGEQITVSVYAKRNAATDQVFRLFGNTGVSISTPFTATSEWQRFTYTYTATVTGGRTMGIYSVQNLTSDIQIWGFQFEVGAYATSYIGPTTTASVTRNQDVINNAGDASTFNDSEGVLYVDGALLSELVNDARISISDGLSVENRITFRYLDNNEFNAQIGFTSGFSETITLNSITDYNKIALVYNSTNASIFVNGLKVATNTMSALSGLSQLQFGRFNGAAANNFYGNVKQVVYFPTALTDDQLAQLTTI
jgi:hypothetical protein